MLLLTLIIFGFESNTSLIFPLPFQTYCTSSFGEYRFNHFHGGVDFSTKGEEGHPVLAVGDGRISRVRREPSGYGRVLYLDLNDGRTAVYGHLIRFSRTFGIEKRLEEECKKRGTSFPKDIYFFPPIEVKKGDVVAFSGSLGIGSPHLHFEIRKGEELCDPFNEGISFETYSTPLINSLYFVPDEEGAKVNSSLFPEKIPLIKKGKGNYFLKEDVSLEGRCEIFINVSDSMGSDVYKTFPGEIQGKIDGKEFFYMNLKGVSLKHYKKSPFLFDIIDGDVYLKMKKSKEITLNEIRGEGWPSLKGRHNLEITVKNRGGKSATLRGVLDFSEKKGELKEEIPFSIYKIIKTAIYRNGVGITFIPLNKNDSSEILINHQKVSFYISNRGQRFEVLIPESLLIKGSQEITIGKNKLDGLFCKGDSEIISNNFSVKLPLDVLAKIESNSDSISIDVSPEGMKPFIILSAHKRESFKEAIYAGNYFFSYLNAKPKNLFKAKTYKIFKDDKPPLFSGVSVRTIPNIFEKELRIDIKDNLSGVDVSSIKLFVDGEAVYPDWDGEASSIRVDLTGLARGEHSVSASVKDKMGNMSSLPKTKFFL